MPSIEQLYQTLQERLRPEDVAEMVAQLLKDQLSPEEAVLLEKAASGALSRQFHGYTSMLQKFAKAVGAGKQVGKAIELFHLQQPAISDYNNAVNIEAFLYEVSPLIQKPVGQNDFKIDRLNKEQRQLRGLDISKRSYNKKWRLLKRIERKLKTFILETKKIEFQKISKHGLAHRLSYAQFAGDINTACFIAYYNARCNMRSKFTIDKQERPFDEISEMLLNRVLRNAAVPGSFTPDWWAIAHIYTGEAVLDRLSDEEKGKLLGIWTDILHSVAEVLEHIWSSNDINRSTMVVKRGNDSTTWNNTAGAWNKARDNWINLLYSLGMDFVLDDLCFGKVLRLMAADVVAWHAVAGGKLDPNTEVWNKLPLPWEVFRNKADCTRQMVTEACKQAGIDPEKSGWIAPRLQKAVAFKPTPELVHGVEISSPFLATVLKRHKYFSGKNVKPLYPENN